MSQPFRLADGGAIDRDRPVRFRFDGREYTGFDGDTLASALLANGVRLVARSFKYHRPRGIVGLGVEDPCALVDCYREGAGDPNCRATMVALEEGLVARSQNCWPSLRFDFGAGLGALSPFLPAGFYYKTFMAPARWWKFYEPVIRRLAGLGTVPEGPGDERYERRNAHCDVLVAGGGPAGLAAALAAAHSGARVILADDQPAAGGRLLLEEDTLDDRPAQEWVRRTVGELSAMPNVRVLGNTTVAGYYDHNFLTLLERCGTDGDPGSPRERLWRVRAGRVVLATGATERPIVFGNNDRPGVMLASAVRGYLFRYGVACGRRAVVFTNNDDAYRTAFALHDAGVAVAAVVDVRSVPGESIAARARARHIPVLTRRAVTRALGRRRVHHVEVGPLDEQGRVVGGQTQFIECDLVCVSGGWNPTVHLHSQNRGSLAFDPELSAFVPASDATGSVPAGACAGQLGLGQALAGGRAAGIRMAGETGHCVAVELPLPAAPVAAAVRVHPVWSVTGRAPAKCFVDLQNDVTVADISLAAREGYVSVEHLKRYTTLGMGTDQGRLGNVVGLALLSAEVGLPMEQVGTTTFRPPFIPLTLGAIIGEQTGELARPVRRTAAHRWHAEHAAVFTPSGSWRRPQFYRHDGETDLEAVNREVGSVRAGVGIVDVSTLGKLDVQGRDAAEFLDRVYLNRMRKLAIGRARYGVMLRDDGVVYDDGLVARLDEHHYVLSMTTANADAVAERLAFLSQVLWRDLEVHVTPVTEQWFSMALSGPRAREVLRRLTDDIDVDNAAFPHMAVRLGHVAGHPVRVFRLSFCGELSYEINVAANRGHSLWCAVAAAGADLGLAPYGTESMGVMRVEKGHLVVGREADGRTLPQDLGLGKLVREGRACVGSWALALPAARDPGRLQLVGLRTERADERIPVGAHLVELDPGSTPGGSLGYTTSTVYSPTLGSYIALALLQAGTDRIGQVLGASSPTADVTVNVRVVDPAFVDPQGERVHV